MFVSPVNVTDHPLVTGGIETVAGLLGGALEAPSIRRDVRGVLLDDPAMVLGDDQRALTSGGGATAPD